MRQLLFVMQLISLFSIRYKNILLFFFQSILKVFTDDGEKSVPVTPETTCADVLECLRDPGEDNLCITEVRDNYGKLPCRKYSYTLDPGENTSDDSPVYV